MYDTILEKDTKKNDPNMKFENVLHVWIARKVCVGRQPQRLATELREELIQLTSFPHTRIEHHHY